VSVAIVVNDGQHSKQESPLVCDKNSVLYGFGQGERLTSVNLNELGTRQGYAMNLDENYDRYASPSANIYANQLDGRSDSFITSSGPLAVLQQGFQHDNPTMSLGDVVNFGNISEFGVVFDERYLPYGSEITDEARAYIMENQNLISSLMIIVKFAVSLGAKLKIYVYRDPEEPAQEFTVKVVWNADFEEVTRAWDELIEMVDLNDPEALSKMAIVFDSPEEE